MKKLLLIDGNSLVFRAYHATSYGNLMRTSNGIPTNAVFGFANMIQKALSMIKADAVLVAFDTGNKTFRHDNFPDYKANRKALDDDLIVQFPIVREYLDAMNIPRYEQDGIEADDIIGTMVKKYSDWDINVLSSDKDLLQLIDETTSVWLMKKGLSEFVEVDIPMLHEMYELAPKQIIELKGLMGDNSDNIPGIPGVGEKTAIKLLVEYGSIDNVYQNVDKIKGKLQEKIIDNKELAYLSKELATINTECVIDIDANELIITVDAEKQYDFFSKYEMKSFLKYLDLSSKKTTKKLNYQHVTAVSRNDLSTPTAIYLDYSDKNNSKADIKGFGLTNEKICRYIGFADAVACFEFREWLSDKSCTKIVYNYKDTLHIFDRCGNFELNNVYDLMITSFLLKSNLSSWKSFVDNYKGSFSFSYDDIYKACSNDLDEIKYSCEISDFLFNCYQAIGPKLVEEKLDSLYYDLEYPLSKVLFNMEKTGIKVDMDVLDKIASETLTKITTLSSKIYELAGIEFNINSPKRLSEVLYDDLRLPSGKKRSTAVDVLEKLEQAHPIISLIMEYRKYQKLYSTYAEGLKKYVHDDGRIHTQYNQCVTQTGRLSSTEPNLQNISVRSEEGREIRKAFIADNGSILMAADYSQVELRVLAGMANEPSLIEAFCNDMDIHTKTAMNVFGVSEDEVTSSMRRKAKAVNFGIVYGISDFGLAQQIQVPRYEAKEYIDKYFETYPRIKEYMDEVITFCEKNGYVVTLLNRRRDIPEIHAKEYMTREFGKRAAMNAPIQGTAADLIKIAMINIDKAMNELKLSSRMLLQVHDELVFNVLDGEYEVMKELIEREMTNAMKLKVPLVADCVSGKSWYEAK